LARNEKRKSSNRGLQLLILSFIANKSHATASPTAPFCNWRPTFQLHFHLLVLGELGATNTLVTVSGFHLWHAQRRVSMDGMISPRKSIPKRVSSEHSKTHLSPLPKVFMQPQPRIPIFKIHPHTLTPRKLTLRRPLLPQTLTTRHLRLRHRPVRKMHIPRLPHNLPNIPRLPFTPQKKPYDSPASTPPKEANKAYVKSPDNYPQYSALITSISNSTSRPSLTLAWMRAKSFAEGVARRIEVLRVFCSSQ